MNPLVIPLVRAISAGVRKWRERRKMKKTAKKLKAGFSGLLDAKASESYSMWVALGLKMLSMFAPSVMGAVDGAAGFISGGEMTGNMLLGGLIGYSVMRMTSKAAKAE